MERRRVRLQMQREETDRIATTSPVSGREAA
jgi:hypothetical protein